jgi:hypothetical protein
VPIGAPGRARLGLVTSAQQPDREIMLGRIRQVIDSLVRDGGGSPLGRFDTRPVPGRDRGSRGRSDPVLVVRAFHRPGDCSILLLRLSCAYAFSRIDEMPWKLALVRLLIFGRVSAVPVQIHRCISPDPDRP